VLHQISSKVNEEVLENAAKIMKRTFPLCRKNSAWDVNDPFGYSNCTHQIGASNPQILAAMDHIERIAKEAQYSPNDIWLSLEEFDHYEEGYTSRAVEVAVNKIKHMGSGNLTSAMPCSENCLEGFRNIITQLKLIEWGYHGTTEATGGLYLAYHAQKLGNYFKNSYQNQWPYNPLHDQPNALEIKLNELLKMMTKEMSNGKLKETSILDLPAYGSRILTLDNNQITEANWPNEVNFAIYDEHGNLSQVFSHYKNLSHLWKEYIDSMNGEKMNSDSKFPPRLIQNQFDFSNDIVEDFSTFFKVISGSFPTALKETQPTIWFETAKVVFNDTLHRDFVEKYGLYDKVIMGCSFREDLTKKKWKDTEPQGGCQYFDQSVTNNGLCYSFNALKPSTIWKPSQLINLLEKNVTEDYFDYRYGGTGATRGNF
jgi:hypothetical protein